jgi:hypothetical protein
MAIKKRTLHLYMVTATNLVFKVQTRANVETLYSVQIGPSSSYKHYKQ